MKRLNPTTLFLILVFVISYAFAGAFYLSGAKYGGMTGTIFAVCYMFMPLVSVLIVEKLVHRNPIRERLMISFNFNGWFLVACLLPPVLAFGAFGLSLLFPEVSFSPDMEGMFARYGDTIPESQKALMRQQMESMPVHPIWIGLFSGVLAGATINAVAAFGEELGWRGFLVNSLGNLSFAKASLAIGFVWGVWHAPLILMGHNYPEHPEVGVAMMTAFCMLLSPLFLYVTMRSSSVIAASMMHGVLNGTAGLSIMLLNGGDDLTVGMTGLAGLVVIALAIVGLVVYDRLAGSNLVKLTVREGFTAKAQGK